MHDYTFPSKLALDYSLLCRQFPQLWESGKEKEKITGIRAFLLLVTSCPIGQINGFQTPVRELPLGRGYFPHINKL